MSFEQLEQKEKTDDSEAAIFKAEDYLLGIVQRILSARQNSMIALEGKGELHIFPERGEYFTNILDMAAFCRSPSDQFETIIWNGTIPPASASAKPISDLLWQAAFYSSQGRLVEGCSKYDVAQFRHWPNLTRLPTTSNTARICALLTRHPSTVMIVHRILGIDKTEVYQNYTAAKCAGIAFAISGNPEVATILEAAQASPSLQREHGLFRSLFAKISGL